MRCESCGKPATQIREEYSYCDHCWARKYSVTMINGKAESFRDILKNSLERMGLTRKDGETIDQWAKRCRACTPKQYGGLA